LGPKTGPFFDIFGVVFLTTCWTTFRVVFGIISESLLGFQRSQKVDPFLERLLVAIWRHFGRLLGCLGALLGGLAFQMYCKKQYKTAIIKITSLRYRKYLGWLLEAMLAHFGEVLTQKWSPQTIKNWSKKRSAKNTYFWTSFGPILGCISGAKFAPEGDQKWDHFWNRVPRALRGLALAFSGNNRQW
jgi:hypothetical protein